jgi:hydroxyacylglutathione hydrolase
MRPQIQQFICLTDNFGVLLHDPATQATAAIDAPEAGPILAALDAKGWTLTDILITHRHKDHVQGIPGLKQRFPAARIVAPAKEAEEIGGVDLAVVENDIVEIGELSAKIIETPGHTKGHIVYWFEDDDLLFAGDTLFVMGCGRVFETSMTVMWESLVKIANLPEETQVYCGHEYTLANARFALSVDPQNDLLKRRAEEVVEMRERGEWTPPSTIGLEIATNPFLRAEDPLVQAAVGLKGHDPAEVFGELRERKNRA